MSEKLCAREWKRNDRKWWNLIQNCYSTEGVGLITSRSKGIWAHAPLSPELFSRRSEDRTRESCGNRACQRGNRHCLSQFILAAMVTNRTIVRQSLKRMMQNPETCNGLWKLEGYHAWSAVLIGCNKTTTDHPQYSAGIGLLAWIIFIYYQWCAPLQNISLAGTQKTKKEATINHLGTMIALDRKDWQD